MVHMEAPTAGSSAFRFSPLRSRVLFRACTRREEPNGGLVNGGLLIRHFLECLNLNKASENKCTSSFQ